MRRLFVYGTLQLRADTPMARWLADRAVSATPATVPGQLCAIPDRCGWYPLWQPSSRGMVVGTMLTVRGAVGDLAQLDGYEGRDYRRVTVRVRSEGALVAAQAWRWARRLPGNAVPIPGGDFLGWLAETGYSAFR